MKPFYMTIVTLSMALLTTAAPAQTLSAQDVAHELVEMVFNGDAFDAIIDQQTEMIAQLWWTTAGEPTRADMAQRGLPVSAEDEAKLKATMRVVARRVFVELFPKRELLDAIAPIYARHLTADEMSEIIRFYKTPVGTKALRLLGPMMADAGKVAAELWEPRVPIFWERAKAELLKGIAPITIK